jgi:hypothetical protein
MVLSSVEGTVVACEPRVDLLLCDGGERFAVAGLADAEDGPAVFGGEGGRAVASTAVANVGLDLRSHDEFLSDGEVADDVDGQDGESDLDRENERVHV